jgi:hypothetical protein
MITSTMIAGTEVLEEHAAYMFSVAGNESNV